MKKILLAVFCLLTIPVLKAQVPVPAGTWTMYEMSYVSNDGTQTMTEQQMKANGSSTEYFLMEDGKFKMISNMSGSGTMDTYEGTWKFADNKLTYTLTIGDRAMDITWNCELADNTMKLTRTSPDGSLTIVNTFRRK